MPAKKEVHAMAVLLEEQLLSMRFELTVKTPFYCLTLAIRAKEHPGTTPTRERQLRTLFLFSATTHL